MKYIKIREVKSPEIGTELAAGIDFFVPAYNEKFAEDFIAKNDSRNAWIEHSFERIVIASQGRALIPSGIKSLIPIDRLLLATNKSGVATKKGLDVGATLVDADYSGEIHLSLFNPSRESVTIHPGDKVIQFMELQHFSTVEEISEEEYVNIHNQRNTSRGEGGFGSTGNK